MLWAVSVLDECSGGHFMSCEVECGVIRAQEPHPGLGCGPFLCLRAGHALYEVQGERSWLMAWAKTSALGQFEARYRRMRRVLRVITAATLSSLMRKVATWATPAGRRDAVMLSVLYDTGARAQELIDLNAHDVRLTTPAQVRLLGKGRKVRVVPLMDATARLLRDHLRENDLDRPERGHLPLFQNRQGGRLSRSGLRYLLHCHVQAARSAVPGFTQKISPHSMRHTKGVHLLQSGVSLEIIRDFLGHVDVKTTQIYARANLEMKRRALEKVAGESPSAALPSWQQSKSLLDWLRSL